jgi:hypothetical protein
VTQDDRADLYRLAFDEARRRIEVESTTLENARARAGTLLSAAAVVGALVARPVFDDSPQRLTSAGSVGLGAAAACFVWVALAAVLIWWPIESTDTLSAAAIIDGYVEAPEPAGLAETYGNLARFVDGHADRLRRDVAIRLQFFSWAAAAFGVMVLLLPLVSWDARL